MKTDIYSKGACNVVQVAYLGTINNATVPGAVKLEHSIPKGFRLLKVVVEVETAFDGTGAAVKVGTQTEPEKYIAARTVTLASVGAYAGEEGIYKVEEADRDVYATYEQRGESTAGEAHIYAFIVRVEV